MSIMFELDRLDRVLPVDQSLLNSKRIAHWRVLALSQTQSPRLYEHVTFLRQQNATSSSSAPPFLPTRTISRRIPFPQVVAASSASSPSPARSKIALHGNKWQQLRDDAEKDASAVTARLERALCPALRNRLLSNREFDLAALSEVCLDEAVPSCRGRILATLVVLFLEATAQQHHCSDVASLQAQIGVVLPLPGRHAAESRIVAAVRDIWLRRRLRSVSPTAPAGVCSVVLCRDRDEAMTDVFTPFAPRDGKEHPFKLPPMPPDTLCVQLASQLLAVLRKGKSLELLANPAEAIASVMGAAAASAVPSLLYSPDMSLPWPPGFNHLADLVCTLGMPLVHSAASSNRTATFSVQQTLFVSSALATCFPRAAVVCRDRGLVELRCVVFDGELQLEVTHDDGSATLLGTPAALGRLGSSAQQSLHGAASDAASIDPNSIADVHRAIQSWCSRAKRVTSPTSTTDRAKSDLSSVHVPLSRKEVAVLLAVFQSHPHARYISGCGIKSIGVDAHGQLFVERVCGGFTPWSYYPCYETGVRGDSEFLKDPCVLATALKPLALPPSVNALRLERCEIQNMLRFYWAELQRGQRGKAVVRVAEQGGGGGSEQDKGGDNRMFLHAVDVAAIMHVLRHHRNYYTVIRGCGVHSVFVAQCSPELRHIPSFFAMRICGTSVAFSFDDSYEATGTLRHRQVLADENSRPKKKLRDFV